MNQTNRTAVVLLAALLIVLAAVVIMLAWVADTETVNRLRDFVQYLDDHRDNAGKLIVTLCALLVAVLALLVIILELAPEEEEQELRVQQAGATTIVPAQALRMRLQEALMALPEVTAARARVMTRNKGIAASLDVTVTPGASIGVVTQEAVRVAVDTVQSDLGLPISGVPTVKVIFGGPKPEPVASSVFQPPEAEPETTPAETPAAETGGPPPADHPPESAAEAATPEPAPEETPPAEAAAEPQPAASEPPVSEEPPAAPAERVGEASATGWGGGDQGAAGEPGEQQPGEHETGERPQP